MKNIFKQEKITLQLTFNPGLMLIGFRTTRPSDVEISGPVFCSLAEFQKLLVSALLVGFIFFALVHDAFLYETSRSATSVLTKTDQLQTNLSSLALTKG